MKFKWKVFTSLMLTISFFLSAVSGIVLYFTPRGRVANWVHWELLGLDKDGWTALHLAGMIVLLIAGLLHLFWFNWKTFLRYLGTRASGLFRHPIEILLSIFLMLVLFLGVLWNMPGVNGIVALREMIKDNFETVEYQPPVPHAEELTLQEFSFRVLLLPLDEVERSLAGRDWQVISWDETLGEFAARYGVSPNEVMEVVAEASPEASSMEPGGSETPDEEEATEVTHGSGYGRMTLDAFCEQQNIRLEMAGNALEQLGVEDYSSSSSLRELADQVGQSPGDFAEAMLEIIIELEATARGD